MLRTNRFFTLYIFDKNCAILETVWFRDFLIQRESKSMMFFSWIHENEYLPHSLAHPQENVYRQEAVKIKQPADLENALKQALTASFAVSLLKRFLKELPEQLLPSEQSTQIFKIINDPAHDGNRSGEIRNILMKIPRSNRDTMRVLFVHLHDIIHQSSTMSPTQTPSSKNSDASFIPVAIATLIKSKERTIKYLIQHATELFDRPATSRFDKKIFDRIEQQNRSFLFL